MFLLVPAYPGSPGQKAVKRLCVCVCVCVALRCADLRKPEVSYILFLAEFLGRPATDILKPFTNSVALAAL